MHWPPGAGGLRVYSGIANNMESKEEKKPDKIKVCYQVNNIKSTKTTEKSYLQRPANPAARDTDSPFAAWITQKSGEMKLAVSRSAQY